LQSADTVIIFDSEWNPHQVIVVELPQEGGYSIHMSSHAFGDVFGMNFYWKPGILTEFSLALLQSLKDMVAQ
jgi:hypothetical protein